MAALPHSIDDEAIATEAVDMGTLITENKALREENKTLHDRLLRALAEAENVRRQADRTITEARRYGISGFAREMLTVVDNLQRTVEAAEKQSSSAENAALLEGVQATLRSFLHTLERFGVRPIDAQGKPFDPNFHEAVMEVEDPSRPPGTVKQVLEQGYTIHNRLLRPTRVVVSKESRKKSEKTSAATPPAESLPEPEDNDLGSRWRARPIDP
jgi:molecular chaperone GrpE